MRHSQGYATISGPDSLQEFDTVVCSHCQSIIHHETIQQRTELTEWCCTCDALICPKCANELRSGGMCKPWERQMEEIEKGIDRQRALNSYSRCWE